MVPLTLALLLAAADPAPKLRVGEAAPAFSLPGTNDRTVQLSEFKGRKKVVLAFFPKAFTGGCTREMAGLRDHQKSFDEAGAVVFGISMDDSDTQKKFADSLKLTFPLLADRNGRTAAAYRVKGALWANRTTFVIDQTGMIAAILEGKEAIDPSATLAACCPQGTPAR
jgi:thioredoxin-dependent peroxiredoxin